MEHRGHRKRIDDKSNRHGFEFLEEHEQLEKMLYVAIPRGNTNPIAHRLLEKYGSLYGVLTADVEELVKVEGVGIRTANFIHDLLPLLGAVERTMWIEGEKSPNILRTPEDMGNYAKTIFYGKLTENFYLISLNKNYQPIRFDKIAMGTVDEVTLYVSETVKMALRATAKYVILAHNHPSASLYPSVEDRQATVAIDEGMRAVGIKMLDHIIVSHGEYISMKKEGIF